MTLGSIRGPATHLHAAYRMQRQAKMTHPSLARNVRVFGVLIEAGEELSEPIDLFGS